MTNMELKFQQPTFVQVDNVGALSMAEKIPTCRKTKHLDLKITDVNNTMGKGSLKFVFVKTTQNKVDYLTKNVNRKTYKAYSSDFTMQNSLLQAYQGMKTV